jgi:hypothetical protein
MEDHIVRKVITTSIALIIVTAIALVTTGATSPISTEEAQDIAPIPVAVSIERDAAITEIMERQTTQPLSLTVTHEETFEQWDISLSEPLQRHTWSEARRIGLDPEILLKLMWRESGYQVDAWRMENNGYESVGLCQINGIVYDWLDERGIDPHTPEGNITAAAEIIQYYMDDRGCSLEQALAAYGAGETGMRAGNGMDAARELLEGELPVP